MEEQIKSTHNRSTNKTGIIDCDVHPYPKNKEEIQSYMKQPWRERFNSGGRGHYGNPVHGDRQDAKPPAGDPAAPTLNF